MPLLLITHFTVLLKGLCIHRWDNAFLARFLVRVIQIVLLKFIKWLWLGDIEIKLVLVGALVAADQGLLLNGAVLLLHLEVPVNSLVSTSSCQQVLGIVLQFLQLVPVELEVVVLQQIDPLRVRQVHLLLLLRLCVYLESHHFLLLVHHHGEKADHLMANALVFLAFYLRNFLLLLYRVNNYGFLGNDLLLLRSFTWLVDICLASISRLDIVDFLLRLIGPLHDSAGRCRHPIVLPVLVLLVVTLVLRLRLFAVRNCVLFCFLLRCN